MTRPFAPNLFKRVHRSFIVSIARVESYTAEVVEVDGVSIPIGLEYRGIMERIKLTFREVLLLSGIYDRNHTFHQFESSIFSLISCYFA